jgi:membrane protease subunit HflK
MTGFYRVNPQQQGVVLRFGEWIRTTAPGLHYHIPYPVESVMTPEVTRDNRIEVGFRDVSGNSSSRRDIADESQMITGDENIVDIDFVVSGGSPTLASICSTSPSPIRRSRLLPRR